MLLVVGISVTDPARPLADPGGLFCRACATKVKANGSGRTLSHAPGGARVLVRAGRPHCTGARHPGWSLDLPVVDAAHAAAHGWLAVADIKGRFGLDPAAVRLLHLRDRFPLPVAVIVSDLDAEYLYDRSGVESFLESPLGESALATQHGAMT